MAEPDDTREPETAPTLASEPAPPPAPQRRGGFFPGLIGGLLGGAAVAAGGGWYAYEHGPVKPALSQLEATAEAARSAEGQVSTLGGKLDQVGASLGGLGGELGSLKNTLDQADTTISALGQRLAAAEGTDRDLAGRLDQTESNLKTTGEQLTNQLAEVNNRLLEVQRAQPADVVDKQMVEDIATSQRQIDEAQKGIADGLSKLQALVAQSLEAGNQQSAALRTVVDATRTRVDEIAAAQRDLMTLKDVLEKQQEVDEQHAASIAETGNQVAAVRSDMEQRLTDVTAKLTSLDAARERSVGLSLAAHSLGTAYENGQPFVPTLEIVQQLGQGDEVVAGAVRTLEPMAPTGIPTFASLARDLNGVEQSLAPQTEAEPNDWLARTTENLQGLVDLHAVGEEAVPGENAVQGAQQALLLQDLPGAVAALKPLAEQNNALATAWVARAEGRIEAGAAIETLRQHVKTMLARQG